MEDKGDLLQHYHAMRAGLLAAIDGLSEAQISETTLDGWAVKDHLIHIAAWDEIRAAEVDRISAGFESVWRLNPADEATLSTMFYEARRAAPAAQARWELATTHERLLAAIERATERGLDASLYGEAGLPSSHEAAHTAWILRWRGEQGL
jgi:hypothetical protein